MTQPAPVVKSRMTVMAKPTFPIIDIHLDQAAASMVWDSREKGHWFTLEKAYADPSVYNFPEVVVTERASKHILVLSYYSIFFLGSKPKDFPADIGDCLLATTLGMAQDPAVGKLFPIDAVTPYPYEPIGKCPESVDKTVQNLVTYLSALSVKKEVEEAIKSNNRAVISDTIACEIIPIDGNEQKILKSVSAAVWDNNSEENMILFFSYFLRLAVKEPENILSHYNTNEMMKGRIVLGWAGLTTSVVPGPINKEHLSVVSLRLGALRTCIGHKLCSVYTTNPTTYNGIRKWFSFRFEYYGMTHCNNFATFANSTDPRFVARNLADMSNHGTIANIIIAFGLYGCKSMAAKELADRVGISLPKMTEMDLVLGRFARCFSTEFVKWLTYYSNIDVTSTIMGAVSVFDSSVDIDTSQLSPIHRNTGVKVARKLLGEIAEADVVASDINKEAKREAYAEHSMDALVEEEDAEVKPTPKPTNKPDPKDPFAGFNFVK